MMTGHKLTDRQWKTSLRDARSVIGTQASERTDLMPALTHEIARKLEGRVTREVMENLEVGVRAALGERGTWCKSGARRYLEACIEGIAEEFAEEFAEDVADKVRDYLGEFPPRIATVTAATGSE